MHASQPKFAFFGTPYVARDTLALLVGRGFVPAVVVTGPDRAKGRGLALAPNETKAWAEERALPVLTPDTIDAAAIESIASYGCDYAIVVAYGKLLPQSLIDIFPKGLLNVHYSLLPKYRGASPVESALLNGDAVTGVSIQKLVLEMDAGDILAVREVAIEPDDTARTLRPRLIEAGAELLAEALPSFIAGTAAFTPQDHAAATRSRKIKKEAGELVLAPRANALNENGADAAATTAGTDIAREHWRKYRAYAESPGTYFFAERAGSKFRVKIKAAEFASGEFRPTRVTPEGKSEMPYDDFLRAGYVPL